MECAKAHVSINKELKYDGVNLTYEAIVDLLNEVIENESSFHMSFESDSKAKIDFWYSGRSEKTIFAIIAIAPVSANTLCKRDTGFMDSLDLAMMQDALQDFFEEDFAFSSVEWRGEPIYIPIDESSQGSTQKSGGCYIATCVYGSYDCPQVWTLRRYRDDTLAASVFGRAFIRIYYAISPTLVKWFGHTEWFKKVWKRTLDCMVEHLLLSGVESSHYEDKVW